jgi:hypothetical protein
MPASRPSKELAMPPKRLFALALLAALLASCDGATPMPPTAPPIFTWIDAPSPNASLPLAPTTISFHGATPNGVELFQIRINGQLTDTVNPMSTGSGGSQYGTLFFAETEWSPQNAGTYLISVQAKANGGPFGEPTEVEVTVGSVEQAQIATPAALSTAPPLNITPMAAVASATWTPTSAPTEPPAPSDQGLPAPDFSSDGLYYRGTSCGPNELTVRIDPANTQVYSVVLFYRLKQTEGGDTTEWSSVAMNPVGGGAFTRTLRPEADIPGFSRFLQAALQVQLVATKQNGEEVARTSVLSEVTLKACSAAAG